jgi:ABC-2 type transport system ATP-binding protein
VDAIVVDELEKRYGAVQALDGVGFRVRAGEVFGLLGPNGAGKSTTVKVLATLTSPDSGRAEVAGRDVVSEPNAVRRAIGYVPQSSGVDRDATGRENLTLQGRIQAVGGKALEARVDELLTLLGLEEAADRVVRGYSGGMKRRLDVGLGLVHRPQVLFLDEPTTGLDPEARASMWDELERLAEGEALTILLTTHYMEEADQLADRLAIVSRGRVVVEGTPEELKRSLRGDAVEVELSDGRAADAESVVAGLEDVHEASSEGRKLRSRVANGARAIPAILSALEARGIGVEAVTTHRPSLDDVYLHYTGREFAAEDEAGGRGDDAAASGR